MQYKFTFKELSERAKGKALHDFIIRWEGVYGVDDVTIEYALNSLNSNDDMIFNEEGDFLYE